MKCINVDCNANDEMKGKKMNGEGKYEVDTNIEEKRER